jgi:hypothetical protein
LPEKKYFLSQRAGILRKQCTRPDHRRFEWVVEISPRDKKLLGVHLIGEMAAELVHLGAQVLAAQGTIDTFIHAVYNFPSLSDAYKYAAYDGLGNLNRENALRMAQSA